MKLSFTLNQIMECVVCKESMEDHAEDCPVKRCEDLCKLIKNIQCPICHKGTVDININDFWECRKCKKQFSGGAIVPGYDAAKLPSTHLLDYQNNKATPVVILPDKGKGKITIDMKIKEARKLVNKAKRKR